MNQELIEEIPSSPYISNKIEAISFKPALSLDSMICQDGECIVAGSTDKIIRFLDPFDLSEIARSQVEKKNVSFVAISDIGINGEDPIMITGGKDSVVHVWQPVEGVIEKTIQIPEGLEVRSVSVYQGVYFDLALIGTRTGELYLWDIKKNEQFQFFRGHLGSVHCVCIDSVNLPVGISSTRNSSKYKYLLNKYNNEELNELNSLCIVSGSSDRVVRQWDCVTGSRIYKYEHIRSISSMLIANEEKPLLITAGVERSIKIWDIESGELLQTIKGHLDQINCLRLYHYNEELSFLFSGSNDNTIRIYDVNTGECFIVLEGHSEAVLAMTIIDFECPKLISSGDDLAVIQWNLAKIISDFYGDEKTGQILNERNSRPSYIPKLNYQAPEELDRSKTSKSERKSILLRRKKEKRKKFLPIFLKTLRENLDDKEYQEEFKNFILSLGISEDEIIYEIEKLAKEEAHQEKKNLQQKIQEKQQQIYDSYDEYNNDNGDEEEYPIETEDNNQNEDYYDNNISEIENSKIFDKIQNNKQIKNSDNSSVILDTDGETDFAISEMSENDILNDEDLNNLSSFSLSKDFMNIKDDEISLKSDILPSNTNTSSNNNITKNKEKSLKTVKSMSNSFMKSIYNTITLKKKNKIIVPYDENNIENINNDNRRVDDKEKNETNSSLSFFNFKKNNTIIDESLIISEPKIQSNIKNKSIDSKLSSQKNSDSKSLNKNSNMSTNNNEVEKILESDIRNSLSNPIKNSKSSKLFSTSMPITNSEFNSLLKNNEIEDKVNDNNKEISTPELKSSLSLIQTDSISKTSSNNNIDSPVTTPPIDSKENSILNLLVDVPTSTSSFLINNNISPSSNSVPPANSFNMPNISLNMEMSEHKRFDLSLKQYVKQKQTHYNIATIEHQLSTEYSRNKASQKLADRLNKKRQNSLKNNNNNNNNNNENNENINNINENLEKNTKNNENDEDNFDLIKNKKIKQHEVLHNKRKQSLLMAQQRSGLILQKRLEEQKKLKQLNEEKHIEESNSDSNSDSDSDNKQD